MQQLNLITGQTKEEIAIEFIRQHEPPEGYFLGFSGGKDSVVLHDLAEKAGVQYTAYYSATGIDPPEVVRFIREYYPQVIWKRPMFRLPRKFPNWPGTRSFYEMIQLAGYPSRRSRWCCAHLKERPTWDVPLPDRLFGHRAEESASRAKRGEASNVGGQMVYRPIFHWLEWEVWDYIEANNLPVCSLYDEGFDRIGCVVCPFICHGIKGRLKRNMDRWPKQYKAFEKAMKKLFDNYLCVVNPRSGGMNYRRETDFTELINNWYRGK